MPVSECVRAVGARHDFIGAHMQQRMKQEENMAGPYAQALLCPVPAGFRVQCLGA